MKKDLKPSILGAIWFQALVPFIQLGVIVALTRDSGHSVSSRVLRTPLAQWLGKLSMCIYLVHLPILYYVTWILHGSAIKWPEIDCSQYESDDDRQVCEHELRTFDSVRRIPLWAMPIVWILSILFAVVLYYGVEEPGRKLFRAR
jgi:peptidoglycan/LPS O-acetylase OafA/YrhL